ncbi:MAG: MFS transporter [Rhizobiaceae bacterium]
MPLPLIALFVAAFAFGTTEFVIAGILPQVADGLGVSIPSAGFLVTGYAAGIAIGGPILTVLTARVSRTNLLIAIALVFTVGQVACALAPGFASMLAFRVFIAFAHGVYFGVAMVVATSLVPEHQRGRAVAIVLAGLTVSNILGVPAGTAIGNAFGWRATFWAMFILGVIATIAMLAFLPRKGAAATARPAGFMSEVRVLGRQQVWSSLIVMLTLMISQFVPYTYITPFLTEVTGIEPGMVTWVLLLNGIGCTLGVFLGGRLADWHLMPSLIALLVLQALIMVAMYFASPHPWVMIPTMFVWGCVAFAIGTPIQTRILGWTTDAPNLASALIPSGFNFGIALAASIGAFLLSSDYGYRSLPVLGIGAMVIGAIVATLSYAAERRSGAKPPMPAVASS